MGHPLPPAAEASIVRKLKNIQSDRAVNRRNFMAGLGALSAAATGAALLNGCSDNGQITTTSAAGPSQTDVINFALNLEYLESTFYSYITTGSDISATLTGGGPAPTGAPAQITFPSQVITDVFNEIAFDEINHVANLRTVLGSSAVARPALALDAMGAATATTVLNLARSFEDVGVTAYAGAAVYLTGTNLTYAAQILAVEGFHASVLRYLYITAGGSGAKALDSVDVLPADPGTAALAAAGPTTATGGFFATAGTANANTSAGFFPGFSYTRTTSQVLQIVYNTPGVTGSTKGGFFPSGVNGNITTT